MAEENPNQEVTEEQLAEALKSYGSPQPEEKHNVHTFLHKITNSNDTTKTGFLSDIELGTTPYSERTYKNLSLMSDELCNDDIWSKYFKSKAEILTATSLSRNAKLISLAVLQRRELADMTDNINKKPNSGQFGFGKKKEVTTT